MEVVSQIVSACSSAVTIKDAKEADLRPLNVEVLLALGLENVEDDRDTILIIITNDSLISIGSIRFNNSTLLLGCFCRLMVLEEECLWIENGRVLSK